LVDEFNRIPPELKFQCLHRLYAFCDLMKITGPESPAISRFNAFTGFMLSATQRGLGTIQKRARKFQCLHRLYAFCDFQATKVRSESPWEFQCLHRLYAFCDPAEEAPATEAPAGFNAFTGFMLSATEEMTEKEKAQRLASMFQCLHRLYAFCDREQGIYQAGFHEEFQCLHRLYAFCDNGKKCWMVLENSFVSMPSQALCFLRRKRKKLQPRRRRSFNAFTGFMLSATGLEALFR